MVLSVVRNTGDYLIFLKRLLVKKRDTNMSCSSDQKMMCSLAVTAQKTLLHFSSYCQASQPQYYSPKKTFFDRDIACQKILDRCQEYYAICHFLVTCLHVTATSLLVISAFCLMNPTIKTLIITEILLIVYDNSTSNCVIPKNSSCKKTDHCGDLVDSF